MDYKRNGLVRHTVFVLMLLEIQRSLVFSAPTPPTCFQAIQLTDLLKDNVHKLLEEYKEFHGSGDYSMPAEVPESTVSGSNISEKLQNIYTRNLIFEMHMCKVKEYQQTVWKVQLGSTDLESKFWNSLTHVTGRLAHLSGTMKMVLEAQVPKVSEPSTPAPLQVTHDKEYQIKVYGRAVLDRLEGWLTEVLKVLPHVTGVCKEN